MATVDELARDLVGSLALSEAYLIAVRWIDNRYKQLVSRVRFKHLRKIGAVSIPATINAATIEDGSSVDATRGSTAVTGTDTTWATSPAVATHTDWWIKISSAWYRVAAVVSDTSLTLATAFAEDDVDDGSYSLVKRTHSLGSTVRWLGDFMFTRLGVFMGPPVALEELDRMAPGRILTSQFPSTVAQIGVDSNFYIQVEFYPYSAKSEIVHYVYWDLPTALTIASTIPAQVDPYVLKEGALIDAYRFLKSKARMSGQTDAANSWGNDEQRQQTRWERNIIEAIRTDQGSDDKTFILSMYGGQRGIGDIVTARDHILSNWSYPG
jgi:hypothetical protein